jgi:ATP-dependent DNA ligase
VKWDGFRAVVSTEGPLRVRSRRGWDMTERIGFLAQLPVRAVLDRELVAPDEERRPDFPRVCECVLNRHDSIPLTLMVFDVLSVEAQERHVTAVLRAPPHPRRDERQRAALANS